MKSSPEAAKSKLMTSIFLYSVVYIISNEPSPSAKIVKIAANLYYNKL